MKVQFINNKHHPEIKTIFMEVEDGESYVNFSFNTSSENIVKENDKTYLKLEIDHF